MMYRLSAICIAVFFFLFLVSCDGLPELEIPDAQMNLALYQQLTDPYALVKIGELSRPHRFSYHIDNAACLGADPASSSLSFEAVSAMTNAEDVLIAVYAEHDGAGGRFFLPLMPIGGTSGVSGNRRSPVCAFLINPTGQVLTDTVSVYVDYWHDRQSFRDTIFVIPDRHSIPEEAMVSVSGAELELLPPSNRIGNSLAVKAQTNRPDYNMVPTILWRMSDTDTFAQHGIKMEPLNSRGEYRTTGIGVDTLLTEEFTLTFMLLKKPQRR